MGRAALPGGHTARHRRRRVSRAPQNAQDGEREHRDADPFVPGEIACSLVGVKPGISVITQPSAEAAHDQKRDQPVKADRGGV